MFRIHAGPHVALVADNQPGRNLATKELPSQTMRWIHLSLKTHHSVTAGNHHPAPQPATAARLRTDLRQKSFSWSKFHWIHLKAANCPNEHESESEKDFHSRVFVLFAAKLILIVGGLPD
jgi:hypothetical protein